MLSKTVPTWTKSRVQGGNKVFSSNLQSLSEPLKQLSASLQTNQWIGVIILRVKSVAELDQQKYND